jgi:hypothetical protein
MAKQARTVQILAAGTTQAMHHRTDGATGTAADIPGAVLMRDGTDNAMQGQTTMANSLPVVPASDYTSENHIGEVGGNSDIVKVGITGSTTPAYSLNDVVGGKLTITSAMRINNGKGTLQDIVLVDTAAVHPPLEILLFSQDPTGGTYTDNAAFALNTTDAGNLIDSFTLSVSDWKQLGGTNLWLARVDPSKMGRVVEATGSNANLYAVLVATATFTLTSTTQLRIAFGFLRD